MYMYIHDQLTYRFYSLQLENFYDKSLGVEKIIDTCRSGFLIIFSYSIAFESKIKKPQLNWKPQK